MERLTTDNPLTNMEILANFAYAKDKEVHLIYGDGLEDVTLADYIVEHAKSDFGCSTNREDVINGDSCWECDCPLAVLNAVATQAAELRSRLKKYEDAEDQGRLIVLPNAEIGETLFYVINGKIYEGELYRVAYENYHGKIHTDVSAAKGYNSFGSRFEDFGKTVFLSREEAEKALEGMK